MDGLAGVKLRRQHLFRPRGRQFVDGTGLMVTDNLADYESRAGYYASKPEALLAMKQRLQKLRTTSALFNPADFARGLEQQYQNMWQEAAASN